MTSSFVRAAARGAFALALCATGVWAQGYPERPVRLIVSFTAGGTTDIVARLFAQQLAPLLNQPVVVENKPGAGGLIGTDFVAKAPPDGYTLLLANAGQTIAAAIRRKLPFEGGAGAVMEVIAGRIDLQFEPVIGALPHVKEGKLRALAVTSRQPTSLLPDVPAAAQTVSGYVFQSWLGLAAPAATSPAIVARLNRELRRILGEPDVQKRLAEFGGVAAPSTPDEMRAQVTSEIDRWRQLVNNRHIEQQ